MLAKSGVHHSWIVDPAREVLWKWAARRRRKLWLLPFLGDEAVGLGVGRRGWAAGGRGLLRSSPMRAVCVIA